jgi:hypothetical protein
MRCIHFNIGIGLKIIFGVIAKRVVFLVLIHIVIVIVVVVDIVLITNVPNEVFCLGNGMVWSYLLGRVYGCGVGILNTLFLLYD